MRRGHGQVFSDVSQYFRLAEGDGTGQFGRREGGSPGGGGGRRGRTVRVGLAQEPGAGHRLEVRSQVLADRGRHGCQAGVGQLADTPLSVTGQPDNKTRCQKDKRYWCFPDTYFV